MDTLYHKNGKGYKWNFSPVVTYQVANDYRTFELQPQNRNRTDTIRLKNIDSLTLKHYFDFDYFSYYKLHKGDFAEFKFNGTIPSVTINNEQSAGINFEALHYVSNKPYYDYVYGVKDFRHSISNEDYLSLTKHKLNRLDELQQKDSIRSVDYVWLKKLFDIRIVQGELVQKKRNVFDYDLVSDDMINNATYRDYLVFALYYDFGLKRTQKNKDIEFKVAFDSLLVHQNNFPPLSFYYLMNFTLEKIPSQSGLIPFKDRFEKFQQLCEVPEIIAGFKEKNYLMFESLGNESKQFAFLNLKKKKILYNEVLSNFKGNIIYIDFWASWCGPCIAELPNSKMLKETYKDQKVSFAYISIDDDIGKWEKAAMKHNVMENSFLNIPAKNSIDKQYKIGTIPRYMILDKTGKIVNEDAPRPSDPKLKVILNDLLK